MGLFIDCRYAIRNLLKSVKFSLLVLFIIVGSLTISLIGFNFVHTIMFSNIDNYETSSDIRILRVRNSITEQRDFTYSMIEPFSDLAETNNLDEWLAIQRTRLFISNGKQANLILTKEINSYNFIPYSFGNSCIEKIFIKGEEII